MRPQHENAIAALVGSAISKDIGSSWPQNFNEFWNAIGNPSGGEAVQYIARISSVLRNASPRLARFNIAAARLANALAGKVDTSAARQVSPVGISWPNRILAEQLCALSSGIFDDFERAVGELVESTFIDISEKYTLVTNLQYFYTALFRSRYGSIFNDLEQELIDGSRANSKARMKFLSSMSTRVREELKRYLKVKYDTPRPAGVGKRSRSYLVVVEDLSPIPSNTLTKLLIDWLYLVLSLGDDRTATIYVAKSHLSGGENLPIMFGVHDCNPTDMAFLYREYGLATGVSGELMPSLEVFDPTSGSSLQSVVDVLRASRADCAIVFPTVKDSPLQAVVRSFLPTVAIEIMNGLGYFADSDVYIPNGNPSDALRTTSTAPIVQVQIPQIPFPVRAAYSRDELGATGSTMVVVSAGVDFDIRMGVHSDEFWRGVVDVLRKRDRVMWLFVGVKEISVRRICQQYPEISGFLENGRCQFRAYETDLRALFRICDIYVHPPIAGGSRGVGLAASEHLPILALPDSDAANYLPAKSLFADIFELFDFLLDLIDSEDARLVLAAESGRLFGEEALRESALGLERACDQAILLRGVKHERTDQPL